MIFSLKCAQNSHILSSSTSSAEPKKEYLDDEAEEEYFYPQPSKLASREFFGLLQTCLKAHEDQRDVLLSSLLKQLQHFVRSTQDVSH